MKISIKKSVPIFIFAALCGLTLCGESHRMNLADAPGGSLPAGWRPYMTGPAEARESGGNIGVVKTATGNCLKIEDRSDLCEYGISRVFDCKPGTFFRISARYRAAAPEIALNGLEISAYFLPAVKYRAGTIRPDNSGTAVLDTVVAPPGSRQLVITFYSYRPTQTAVLLESLEVESSPRPFPPLSPSKPPVYQGRTFYLSPAGEDSAAGNRAAPWRSIDKANRQLAPGDTAVFLPGHYAGTIRPVRSGASDAPVVYRAEKPGTAVLTGPKTSGYAARIENRTHIELDGFRFDVHSGNRWLEVAGSHFCTFRNLHLENAAIANPISCRNSSSLRFSNIRAIRCTSVDSSGTLSGDMWNNYNITRSVFENMYLGQVGHRPFGLWYDCSEIVIRNSIFDCRWGRNFEFFSPRKVLMERCVITNAFEGSGSFDGEAKLFLNESIFRHNLILRNGYLPIRVSGYQYRDMPGFTSMDSRYYHNTFYRNEDAAIAVYGDTRDLAKTCCRNNIFQNNVFFGNNFDRGTAIQTGTSITPDCQFRSNLIAGEKPGARTIQFADGRNLRLLTTREAEKAAAPYFTANTDADPHFVAPEKNDFSLAAASPAIDAGKALTVTRAAGNDTIFLPVEDVRFFFDGFAIPGESGDLVMIGPDKLQARITRIVTHQNILVLDRRVAFARGDSVSPAYGGKAPDLGAYETGMPQSTGPTFDPTVIQAGTSAGNTLLASDFEAENREQWFHLWNFTRQPSSFAFIDNTTAATGKQSWRVEHVPYEKLCNLTSVPPSTRGGKSTLSTHLSPAWWEMEQYPVLQFAYRIPAGVPLGVTLYCDSRRAAPGAGSVVVAETPDFPLPADYVRQRLAELTADNQWHVVKLDLRQLRQKMPDYQYVYKLRFWAGGVNGNPGARYWLDDVIIRTADDAKQ